MSKDGESEDVVKILVTLVVLFLPLLIKLFFVYAGYKRRVKRRRRIFRKALKKEGIDNDTVKRLCGEIEDISLRELVGKFSGDMPFLSSFKL